MTHSTAATGLDFLVVGAHPDDAELGCGGTLARFSREGRRTGILDLTEGELGTRGTPQLRAQEAHAAGLALGVVERCNLRLKDGFVDSDDASLVKLVEELRRLRPRILALPYFVTRHPDHSAASRLGERAAFLAGLQNYPSEGEPHRPGLVMFYMERIEFQPSFVLDVSDDHATKLAALRCYTSQFSVTDSGSTEPETYVSRPAFLTGIEARSRYFGDQIEVEFGEPYYCHGQLRAEPKWLLEQAEKPV